MANAICKKINPLWAAWWEIVGKLRPAFSRNSTFLWFAAALAARCVRTEHLGVTSFVRALGLRERCYERFLAFFHSSAVKLPELRAVWSKVVLSVLKHFLFIVNGRLVLVADGIKAPRTGRKMPGVKKLHQQSNNNTKPQYIFGHSCQAIAVVARAASSFLAVPLACAIHEGVVFSNRDKRTLLDQLIVLLDSLRISLPHYLVADRYHASAKIINPLLERGAHLICAVRSNAVAYQPAPAPKRRGRGRPRKYGPKTALKNLFRNRAAFARAASPVYSEQGVNLLYRTRDLDWRSTGRLGRFVLVIPPTRGRMIFLSTDWSLDARGIIRCYGVRFKIEAAFKQAVQSLGTFRHHFWMAGMTPRPDASGNQQVHRKSEKYRAAVRRKLAAYHCHLQLGTIVQGLMQILAILHPEAVGRRFGSWLRTVRSEVAPSEFVVALALYQGLPEFLAASRKTNPLAKFIHENLDLERAEGWRLAS